MRSLLIACFILCSLHTYAEPLVISSETQVQTDNWYPLPERDISAAVSDSALAVLTKEFEISIKDVAGAGGMQIIVSLVGPAQIAKATLSIQSEQTGSLVASASSSLRNMDFQGIYQVFEALGQEVAIRISPQLQDRINKVPSLDTTNSTAMQAFYDEAAHLKRQGQYDQAKEIFIRVAQQDKAGYWPELARDEIRYALPIYQAKVLMSDNTSGDLEQTLKSFQKAENLLRLVYAENIDSKERVKETQRMLDNILATKRYIQQAMQAAVLVNFKRLSMLLHMDIASWGECPNEKDLLNAGSHMDFTFYIKEITGNSQQQQYQLVHASGTQVRLTCDANNEVQPVKVQLLN